MASAARRSLSLLHLLHLLRVSLLHLLGLLLMPLFHLLRSPRIGLLSGHLLMFTVLRLLEFLAILGLLCRYLVLLLLEFLILLRVPRVGSSAIHRSQIVRMRCSGGVSRCSDRRRAVIRGESCDRVGFVA